MDHTSSSNSVFDFNSQAGVMSLLAAVRASALSPAEKNELRDLIFLYTNGGGDVSVKITLEQKLIAHNIQVSSVRPSPVAAVTPKIVLPFGSSRPSPVFVSPSPRPSSGTVTPTSPASEPVPAPAPEPEPIPEPVAETVPVAVEIPEPALVAEAPQPVTQNAAGSTNYIDRIREIKTAVNSKVGNPVNLVDINNEVGREYMNALLEAMKSLSGGVSGGGTELAMERLETAFLAVELAIADHARVVPVQSEPVMPAPVVPEAVLPPPVIMPAEAVLPVPPPMPEVPETISEPVIPETPIVPPSPFLSSAPVAPEPVSGFATPDAWSNEIPDTSVLADGKVLTPEDLPAADRDGQADFDPLHAKEIDDGLQQLLSDWALFKKSGLFGTGPKGIEHPLFKKISTLPVHLLLAGRFEGSTQEIKQSITDYMNGWRYEQGIMYEQGETFEHYLRRVIRQILDLQKKHRPA